MTARAVFRKPQIDQAKSIAADGFRVTLKRDGVEMVIERAAPALPSPPESAGGNSCDEVFSGGRP
jgi:hypothetical protein